MSGKPVTSETDYVTTTGRILSKVTSRAKTGRGNLFGKRHIAHAVPQCSENGKSRK